MFSGAGSAERSSNGGLSCSPLEPWDGGGGCYHKDSGDKQRIRRGRDSEQASLHELCNKNCTSGIGELGLSPRICHSSVFHLS